MARRRHRLTVSTPHPRRRAAAVRVSPPQDCDQQDRPTLAELHRRVCVDTASSTEATGAPPTASRSETGARCQRTTSSDRATGLAPPRKSRRPAGFPEASSGPATGLPAPVEEDKIQGGWDEEGMAPEFVVTIPEALEDLNLQPTTMDSDSDSPHPASPRQAASLDSAVEVILDEGPEGGEDPDTEVLRVVPSTQPASPPPLREPSPRVVLEPCSILQFLEVADVLARHVCMRCRLHRRLRLRLTTRFQLAEVSCVSVCRRSRRAHRHLDADLRHVLRYRRRHGLLSCHRRRWWSLLPLRLHLWTVHKTRSCSPHSLRTLDSLRTLRKIQSPSPALGPTKLSRRNRRFRPLPP